ncbi:universal stress protein [Geminicoccus harenae]|uniref:universal stress protein n=1 Tax=Geminicoccus harenae TaxID=2498453 RepID=UPI00168BC011|nr:universal stress protein [Geminicoccus harenae]
MFRHILIPTDGSSLSSSAVEKALRFAREIRAQATLLTVIEPFQLFSLAPEQVSSTAADYHKHATAQAERILSMAEAQANSLGVQCTTVSVEHDQPHEVIVGTALQRNCDLIAMASHGRRGLSAVVLGSQTMKVLAFSKIPVLVYR